MGILAQVMGILAQVMGILAQVMGILAQVYNCYITFIIAFLFILHIIYMCSCA